jgi:peptidyl-prolyl cis-trans isomerase SurA
MVIQRVQQGNVNQLIEITEQEVDNYLSDGGGPEAGAAGVPHRACAAAPVPRTPATAKRSQGATARPWSSAFRGGESFEAVISRSGGDYTFTGGDLGWRKLDDLPSIFQDVAQDLETGEVADLFRSPSGWHIVKMADRRGAELTISQTKVRHILIKPSEILTDEQARSGCRAQGAHRGAVRTSPRWRGSTPKTSAPRPKAATWAGPTRGRWCRSSRT